MIDELSVERLDRSLDILSAARSDHACVSLDVLREIRDRLSMFTWLQYVTHDKVDEFIALGWKVDHDFSGSHHEGQSVLMKWKGEGEPPQPKHLRVVS